MGYSGTPDEVRVIISAEVDRAIAAFKQAAAAIGGATNQFSRGFDSMGESGDRVQRKLEHVSMAVGFSLGQLSTDADHSATHILRAFTGLGFAFGPIVGGLVLGIASIASMMEETSKKTQEESTRMTDALMKDSRRLQDYQIAGLRIQLELLKKQRDEIARAIEVQGQKLSPDPKTGADRFAPMVSDEDLARMNTLDARIRETGRALSDAVKAAAELAKKLAEATDKQGVAGLNDEYDEFDKKMQRAKRMAADLEESDKKFFEERAALIRASSQAWLDELDLRMTAMGIAFNRMQREEEDEKQRIREIGREWEDVFNAIPNAAERAFRDVISAGESMKAFWRFLFQELAAGMVEAAYKGLAAWAGAELAKRNITRQTVLEDVALHTWAALKKIALTLYEGGVWIGVHAAKAAAAAWAAIAGIPFIGPALAPIVAAATLVGVLALGAKLASAAGGYDIPAGVNPLTQLHAQEMVLPKKYADVIRGLDGAGGGDTFHIYAMDGADVERVLMRHPNAVARAAQRGAKNGAGDSGVGRRGGRNV